MIRLWTRSENRARRQERKKPYYTRVYIHFFFFGAKTSSRLPSYIRVKRKLLCGQLKSVDGDKKKIDVYILYERRRCTERTRHAKPCHVYCGSGRTQDDIHTYACICVRAYVCVFVYVCTGIHVCARVCVCVVLSESLVNRQNKRARETFSSPRSIDTLGAAVAAAATIRSFIPRWTLTSRIYIYIYNILLS